MCRSGRRSLPCAQSKGPLRERSERATGDQELSHDFLGQCFPMPSTPPPEIFSAARRYWSDCVGRSGVIRGSWDFLATLWEFLRDSTPSSLRSRFGDADYDWDYRVNTTSGAVGWRDRLLGVFNSPYQPTERELFHEMMDALAQLARINFNDFTFIDLGSGKGRTLLMASDYPFRRIVGVELLPSLNQIAQQNLAQYHSASQKCFAMESICADATTFTLPEGPSCNLPVQPVPGIRAAAGPREPGRISGRRSSSDLCGLPQSSTGDGLDQDWPPRTDCRDTPVLHLHSRKLRSEGEPDPPVDEVALPVVEVIWIPLIGHELEIAVLVCRLRVPYAERVPNASLDKVAVIQMRIRQWV